MQTSCTPLVNLARNPAPMASPSQNQVEVRPLCNASQNNRTASAQKNMLRESMVIRIEPTASIGMTRAINRHHQAVRSS